jgi:hypothetical protein
VHLTFLRLGLGHFECWVVAKTSPSFDYAIKVWALEALVLVAWLFKRFAHPGGSHCGWR